MTSPKHALQNLWRHQNTPSRTNGVIHLPSTKTNTCSILPSSALIWGHNVLMAAPPVCCWEHLLSVPLSRVLTPAALSISLCTQTVNLSPTIPHSIRKPTYRDTLSDMHHANTVLYETFLRATNDTKNICLSFLRSPMSRWSTVNVVRSFPRRREPLSPCNPHPQLQHLQ